MPGTILPRITAQFGSEKPINAKMLAQSDQVYDRPERGTKAKPLATP